MTYLKQVEGYGATSHLNSVPNGRPDKRLQNKTSTGFNTEIKSAGFLPACLRHVSLKLSHKLCLYEFN